MAGRIDYKKLADIFLTFFRIGGFTFGGGFAMIPLIEKEVVDKKEWVSEEEILDVFAVSQTIPGAIAINSATLIGYRIAGISGAIAATLGVIFPSLLVIILIAAFFSRFQDYPVVQNAFRGIRPAIVALISIAAVKIGKTAVKDKTTIGIAAAAAILILVMNVHAVLVILGGAAAGIIIYLIGRKVK